MSSQVLTRVSECLYRNGHGAYYAIVKVQGKQIKRSLRTLDALLAKRRLAEFRQKVERLTGTEKGLLFEDLTKRWLESIRGHLKLSSYNRRVTCINQLIPLFKGKPVRSLGLADIEKWKATRTPKLSARSFNIELETLRLLFEYAKEDLRIILENPVSRIKRRKQDKKQSSIPTKAQFAAFIQEIRNVAKDTAYFVEFLAYSGLRLGEAREVVWQDINFESKILLVTGGEIGTKNHETRTIPLFSPLEELLKKLRNSNSSNHSSIQRNTRIFQIDSAKKAIAGACKRLSLPHWGHHTMRHFFCSNAIEAGIDFKVIAEWLGHKDGGVLVAKTYGHLRNEHSRAMAEKMTFKVEV